jgi:hypothetical protein
MRIQAPRSEIARDHNIIPAVAPTGGQMASLSAPLAVEEQMWSKAIDQLLTWRLESQKQGGDDLPSNQVIDSAIDFAKDMIDGGIAYCAPDSMVPHGGGIAMEWNPNSGTFILEFSESGIARYTQFNKHGKVVESGHLLRNPSTRQFELQE